MGSEGPRHKLSEPPVPKSTFPSLRVFVIPILPGWQKAQGDPSKAKDCFVSWIFRDWL